MESGILHVVLRNLDAYSPGVTAGPVRLFRGMARVRVWEDDNLFLPSYNLHASCGRDPAEKILNDDQMRNVVLHDFCLRSEDVLEGGHVVSFFRLTRKIAEAHDFPSFDAFYKVGTHRNN